MCRSIKQLRRQDAAPSDQEIYEAARQFVRKVSGYRTPSKRNQEVFEQTIAEISAATRRMLQTMAGDETSTRPAPVLPVR